MALVDPSVTVTIAGVDVSSDVGSLHTEQDICALAQTCEIEMSRKAYDAEQGNLSYYGAYRFRDTGQDFTDYDDDTYTLVARNSNGTASRGYMGKTSSPNDDIIRIFSESTRTTTGWVEGGQGSGVPIAYFVFKDDYDITSWDTLVLAINGTNRLTGYVVDITKEGRGYVVRGIDKMKLATDYLLIDEFEVEEDKDAGWWINYWLEYVGIATSGSVEMGKSVPGDVEWQYKTVADIIKECLAYAGGGYVVIVDGDGVAQIIEKTIGASSHTFSTNLLGFSRNQDDSWLRDRAVVFGTTSGAWDGDVWVPGEVTVVAEKPDEPPALPNTVVVSSDFITSQGVANNLAEDLIDFFDESLDIKRCAVPGDETIWLGDSASITDSWTGYSGAGLVTSIETFVDNSGFKMEVGVDEKCGFIWGAGRPYGQIAFIVEGILITGDIGIWFYNDVSDGLTLRNTYSGVKTAPDGDDIEIYVQTSTNGTDWTTQHTNIISDGNKLSGKCETFTDDFVEEDTLVRFYVNQVGSSTAGEDLTLSVGIKVGEM